MDCERAREGFVEALSGHHDTADMESVRRHIDTCALCQEETAALRDAWRALDALDAPPPDPSLPHRFERRVRLERASRGGRWRSWAVAGGLAAALVIGFAAGYGWRRHPADAPAIDAAPSAGYLLLLRAGVPTPPSDQRAVYDEYADWARGLARDGRLVAAEELGDAATWLVDGGRQAVIRPPTPATQQPVVGFFWIRAESLEGALALARNSPHLQQGGTIEIRSVPGR